MLLADARGAPAAASAPQNPASQRAEMVRMLGAIERRLGEIQTSLDKVVDRLPAAQKH